MNRTFAGLAAALALFVTELETSRPADACGFHLIVKSPSTRQAVARSSRPSNILLLGTPSHHLQRNLLARGHKVEVEPSAAAAKRAAYAAVMTDPSHLAEARTKYGADVVFLYKDFATDAQTIESVVARAPTGAKTSRVVLVAKHEGRLVRAGGGNADKSDDTATNQAPAHDQRGVAASVTAPDETRAAKTTAPSKLDGEMFFGVGSASIGRRTAIATAVAWLEADASRTIVIAGFADPSGTRDANMMLSQNRADAVKDAIVSAGIDSSRIEVRAYGDTHLKYGRTDARNRRVSIEGKSEGKSARGK